ncbi:efflux RND transporter periplasmic adaptor subunit [Acinetobacter baumannii]|uniref:Efflux RND transporter periplasmic adaptor subunit n=1 Tax=Acinetobacter baumannii TaxID=470 RepID=A0AAP1QU56_ACIBA|nr:efflux RND transporter periplasmic adaptor subunit [Acinetobacter baumannii]MBD2851176.1 efflux RND transporter periplasmic adaptor subunit [Acinetobacter baumannii]MBD3132466.1 efflux RND transporter periplasmic adaptor subunit [Acinetobacter baumannii]MBE0308404.1 efflux RND transporter periplasmic adaptor subunit [Acinetobacter baumannii]MBE0311401.1 efflux RND transporter periplasmic adaptor subunit [Acinetobacter baumannii]MBE0328749.1 efflux RND transporter periplasmic adaptor subunit
MSANLKKNSQWLWVGVIAAITAILIGLLVLNSKNKSNSSEPSEGHGHAEEEGEEHHDEEEKPLLLTAQQMQEQNLKIEQAELGEVPQLQTYPAKLVVNTDRQAHVSPSFSGRVEAVYVELGQQVKKGQALASLLVPDLVDQQANLQIAQSNLELARQDYERERSLWSQGISAKQDYQRAYNVYQQAQIQVKAARSRLSAFGAGSGSAGRYTLTAPIAGIVSNKDIVVGENVQLADQLFIINQLDQLWLEFILPSNANINVQPNQQIEFKSLQTGNTFSAQVQSLTTEADAQTGRLQVRAQVLANSSELRPNLMVNVELNAGSKQKVTRVKAQAVQQVEGKDVIFTPKMVKTGFEFEPVTVQLGQRSKDGQWVEVVKGINPSQRYVAEGSFLLKSELEKGEAEHGH